MEGNSSVIFMNKVFFSFCLKTFWLPVIQNEDFTIRECLLADRSPVPYPLARAPMAPLCVCAALMRLCMSPWPLGIPVDGPTAWLLSTWMASSRRSRRSSIRLCCRTSEKKVKIPFVCCRHSGQTWTTLVFFLTHDGSGKYDLASQICNTKCGSLIFYSH